MFGIFGFTVFICWYFLFFWFSGYPIFWFCGFSGFPIMDGIIANGRTVVNGAIQGILLSALRGKYSFENAAPKICHVGGKF